MSQEEVECVDVECCHMCFSTERKLSSLDGVVDVYLLIVGLSPDCEESVKDVRACWECRAVLKRIFKFRVQAQLARDVLITADALLLDSDTCMSKLKFSAIEKINLKRKLTMDIVRNVFEVEIAPKLMENVNVAKKLEAPRILSHGVFVQHDNKKLIEAYNSANNMYQGEDPLAMEIKEEDDIDECNFFDAEPACDQDQTDMDEKATSDIKTNKSKSNNLLSDIETVEKDDLSPNYSNVKPFSTSTALDSDDLTETKRLMIVIDPNNLSKHELTPREQKVTMLSTKDKLDKDVIASQNPERIIANSKNINMVESTKPRPNIKNIPSTLLQPVNIQKLDNIQSNVLTVRNKSSVQEDSQKQILLNTTTAQRSQIVGRYVKTGSVPSSGTAQYDVEENLTLMPLYSREVKMVKPDENVKPVKVLFTIPGSKESQESFNHSTEQSKPAKIRLTKVTKSQLNDFLEQARNNEAYLASPFKCEICILGFKEERFLQRHMFRYKHETISKNEFVCDVCLSSMPSERELNEHQSTHDCLYSCTLGDFTSVLPQNVYHHYLEKHSLNKKYKTSLKRRPQANNAVKKGQNGEASAGSKKRKKRKVKVIKYEVFKPTKEDFEYMKMRASLNKGFYQCEDCCYTFHNREKFMEHLKAHTESAGEHECEICKLRFPTAELLRQHTPAHDEWYRCKADPACLYVAQKLSTIKMHIYKHRTKPIRRIRPHISQECSICKKVFPSKRSLKSHMLIHNKQHMCEVCGFFAPTSSALAYHKLQHSGQSDYLVCEFCPMRFTSEKSLRYHRSRHLMVKPYACKLCDEKFYNPTARSNHFNKVHKKKQSIKNNSYKCRVCNVELTSNYMLSAHRATHEELQRYKCDKCPKGFFTFNSLVMHQESHVYISECDICGKVFANRDNLNYHLHSKHKGTQSGKVKKHKETQRVKRKCSECGKVFQSVMRWRDHMKTHLIFPEDDPELSEKPT